MGVSCSTAKPTEVERVFSVPEAGFSIPVRKVARMGWVPDLPDYRDRVLVLPPHEKQNLPKAKDLRPREHFPIYDQGDLGSCTANAIGAAFHFDQVKEKVVDFAPSRLFIYYNERAMDGHADEDSGSSIRNGIKSVQQLGVCDEGLWPYDPEQFKERPPASAYTEAVKTKAKAYARVPHTLDDLRACINRGYPFVFGFMMYQSFMTRKVEMTGRMTMPTKHDGVVGGHAVLCVGYDDDSQCFVVRNSWGEQWGDRGYFYMPYEFMARKNLVNDIWAIHFVEGTEFPTTTGEKQ